MQRPILCCVALSLTLLGNGCGQNSTGTRTRSCTPAASHDRTLCDFESLDSLKLFDPVEGIAIASDHATQGSACARVPAGAALTAYARTGLASDWSGFDWLQMEIFNN